MTAPRAPRDAVTADTYRQDASAATTAAWGIIGVVGLGGFAILTWLLDRRAIIPFDTPLLQLARTWNAYDWLWTLISNAANLPLIAIGVGLVLYLFATHRHREAVLVILVLAAVTAGSEGVKQLVHRPRPPGSDAVVAGVIYSFPSGHTLEATTIFGMITILVWRSAVPSWVRVGVAVAVAIFVVAVAVARVAIDAHYPSDVLAGFLGGMGVLAIFALLTRNDVRETSAREATATSAR